MISKSVTLHDCDNGNPAYVITLMRDDGNMTITIKAVPITASIKPPRVRTQDLIEAVDDLVDRGQVYGQ